MMLILIHWRFDSAVRLHRFTDKRLHPHAHNLANTFRQLMFHEGSENLNMIAWSEKFDWNRFQGLPHGINYFRFRFPASTLTPARLHLSRASRQSMFHEGSKNLNMIAWNERFDWNSFRGLPHWINYQSGFAFLITRCSVNTTAWQIQFFKSCIGSRSRYSFSREQGQILRSHQDFKFNYKLLQSCQYYQKVQLRWKK